MNKKGLIGKLIVINIIVLVALLILLLFFIQGGCEREQNIEELAARALLQQNIEGVYEEAAEKPYFAKHPEELAVKELKIENFRFTNGIGANEKPIPNPKKEFTKGQQVTFSFDINNFMDPMVAENKYVYGLKIWAGTKDSDGNPINSLTSLMADMADYLDAKGKTLSFNMGLVPDGSVNAGEYKMKITAWDRISGLNKTVEESFRII